MDIAIYLLRYIIFLTSGKWYILIIPNLPYYLTSPSLSQSEKLEMLVEEQKTEIQVYL